MGLKLHALCGNRPLATVYAQAKVADSNGEGGETPYYAILGRKANSNTRHGPRLIDGIMYCSTTNSRQRLLGFRGEVSEGVQELPNRKTSSTKRQG
ncbi:hypothetical protein SNOG_02762 [Parastagonospora nodorum SN15]|uniref:Uncharacterized protein n=1 Tax=Phaeosphaeria nodorum (strain SN15 / ATCC MYA-4574 / FGSC 10173) TaxID=321614 RepID=Q0UZQ2_PHANO|nr:hypothetical protein SNOG_02762 [Parastagonospora nodorum SN15]EAT89493.1 hypothetical protein SNOG_02762 [Parastagonospora nodorum SN15]